MNAEIIAVGSELLLGQIVNTNAKFISERLAELGINVYYHTVVGDNPMRLTKAIETAEKRADLIIFTGGLGPTKDDLTKEAIASHLNTSLVSDEEALDSIVEYFKKTNRIMTENNKKQALVLNGADVLPNLNGMAPGMFYKTDTHRYMLLPGPPKEMEPMFREFGMPKLAEQLEEMVKIESRVLRFFGIGEAQLETEIMDLIDGQSNPTIAPLAADGEVTLRLTAKDPSGEKAQQLLDEVEQQILARTGEFFYGYGQSSLMIELSALMKKKNYTIACAESLTGGLFQSELTSIDGASSVFNGGVICYSNQAKIEQVGVAESTINQYGAVSEECAVELAVGIQKKFNTDIGISFTGAAGPEPLEGNPPGTVWIGVSFAGAAPRAFKVQLQGSRNNIIMRTVKYGCHFLLRELADK
ncbi:competence/damage-inducible protein A [Falsibacillus pallidus]|uniref:Putative competence-damage inducible protein n=1 Tax=Falsibacillus pallidus TaxID=493781 RepID=A0A370H005_9BACI|nr:competence/damage-inducible protein A [Falsibacillus pallidus]RDI47383.1 competence/damage-inducible protein cinA [Falsibacillus pallidus]